MLDMEDEALLGKLVELLVEQRRNVSLRVRGERLKQILLLLARGAVLAMVLTAPRTARVFRKIDWDNSTGNDWKIFNRSYLDRIIKYLERQKVVEVREKGDCGEVYLTEKGRRKVLRFGLESLSIHKPARWDGKWRMVFYDVFDTKKIIRERFRSYLKKAGFYPLQKSVYLHAYPCEREIEFLKYFLGIAGEVRVVVAEKIENDQLFRTYFGV